VGAVGSLLRRVTPVETDAERLRREADKLADLLADAEASAALAEGALRAAEQRQPELAQLDADEFTGAIESAEAQAGREEVLAAVAEATTGLERARGVVEVLTQRVADAGQALADAIREEALAPWRLADERVREAEALLAERTLERNVAANAVTEANERASDALAEYDDAHRRSRVREATEKKKGIDWACRRPPSAILQLPLAWQAEARAEHARRLAEHERRLREGDEFRHGWPHRGEEPQEPWVHRL
jgi:hypothetical protein